MSPDVCTYTFWSPIGVVPCQLPPKVVLFGGDGQDGAYLGSRLG